jgi:glucokinase
VRVNSTVALALDFGGTKTEAAFVDGTGRVIAGTRFRQPTGGAATSGQLSAAVTTVVSRTLATLPAGAELLGVGIGTAGPVHAVGNLVSPLNVPAWRRFPLLDLVADCVGEKVPGAPVTMRMDGLCITLAEHWVGAAHGYNNVMGMIVSTGIGGGLILDGRTVSGPTGNAGHIGHVEVAGFDDPCACGGIGCVEAIASGPKTVAWARTQGWHGATGEDLAASFAAGDPVAAAAFHRSGRAIGQAIASATALVDLDVVVIGGGFSHATPVLFDYVREAVATRQEFDFVTKVDVAPSGLSGDGPLIGAGALVHRSEMVTAS